ncbi:uncharacterized protein LOC110700763 [Chenopodium quinoa]|uniref:uncharacterized protein LOC110700763 n=1 Tax=Chenopodium quinoa TaxID=63459 RepID=UPI000B774682|nr:uncharacterized protein LOC110700763 [Chenopodium quinoa]
MFCVDSMSLISSSPSKYKKCNCGIPMARLTSWTRENPGRKFLACKFYDPNTETRGCRSFEWVDEDGSDWKKEMINQLILDKKLMKGEMNSMRREIEDLTGQRRCLSSENDNLKIKCKALNADRKKYSGERQQNRAGCGTIVVGVVLCFMLMFVGAIVML